MNRIAYNARAATVQSDLQALSSIGSGNVLVAGGTGGPWREKGIYRLISEFYFTNHVLKETAHDRPNLASLIPA